MALFPAGHTVDGREIIEAARTSGQDLICLEGTMKKLPVVVAAIALVAWLVWMIAATTFSAAFVIAASRACPKQISRILLR